MTFGLRLQASAASLITRLGKTVTYTIVVSGAYDPATGSAQAVATPYRVKAVVSNVSGIDLLAGTLIEQNQKKLTIAALSLTALPSPNDNVTIDGQNYLVTSADTNYAGEYATTYSIVVRKA